MITLSRKQTCFHEYKPLKTLAAKANDGNNKSSENKSGGTVDLSVLCNFHSFINFEHAIIA